MNPADLRNAVANRGLDSLSQGDISEPATLATARHAEIDDVFDQVDEVNTTAMASDDGVDLLVEHLLHALAKLGGGGHGGDQRGRERDLPGRQMRANDPGHTLAQRLPIDRSARRRIAKEL